MVGGCGEAQLITQELEVDGSVISPLVRLHLSTLGLVGDRGARSSAGQSTYKARTGFFPFALYRRFALQKTAHRDRQQD